MMTGFSGCAGACENNPCDDGLFCNGVELCIPRMGEGETGFDCAPGLAVVCPEDQICDESFDECASPECMSNEDCDDQNPCTADFCIVATVSRCSNRTLRCGDEGAVGCPCSDNNSCTENDVCFSSGPLDCRGTRIVCPEGECCIPPGGSCAPIGCSDCQTDEDCNDQDPCTTDICVLTFCQNNSQGPLCAEGTEAGCPCDDLDLCTTGDMCSGPGQSCQGTPIECPPGQVCDLGKCVSQDGGTTTGLFGAVGTFNGSSVCGDNDDTVSLADNAGTLVLSGFEGNPDIDLTLVDANTATGSGVVAFGVAGHDLNLVLNSDLTMALDLAQPDSGASCGATLTPQSTVTVEAAFTGGVGGCPTIDAFMDTLNVTFAGTVITIEQPSTGDVNTGSIQPDGTFTASQSGIPPLAESYEGRIDPDGSGTGVNMYTDSSGCTSTWQVTFTPK